MNGIHEVTGSIPVWSTIHLIQAKDAHHSAEGATVGPNDQSMSFGWQACHGPIDRRICAAVSATVSQFLHHVRYSRVSSHGIQVN